MRGLDQEGFTLPELLVVSGVFLVLIFFSLLLVNPKSYTAQDNNAQRRIAVAEIMQGINAYQAHTGSLPSGITTKAQAIGSFSGEINLCPELVPTYLKQIPVDPLLGGVATCSPNHAYVSGYTIARDNQGRLTITALAAQDNALITLTN
jgi:prepilin-type N-terminal cleavage/methylation domain-containing protein